MHGVFSTFETTHFFGFTKHNFFPDMQVHNKDEKKNPAHHRENGTENAIHKNDRHHGFCLQKAAFAREHISTA